MTRKLTIGSGYYSKFGRGQSWFYNLWRKQLLEVFGSRIEAMFIVCSGAKQPFNPLDEEKFIHLTGNLEGGNQASAKGHAFCGWAGAMLSTALLAYSNQTDYLWVDQDVLVFGDKLLEQMYLDMGDKQIVFGQRPVPDEACTSLFLCRWNYIPELVAQYLMEGFETSSQRTPERKFYRMRHRWPEEYAVLSVGVDRERPFPSTMMFYAHKLSTVELKELEGRGLISCEGMPETTHRLSCHDEPGDRKDWDK